MKYFIIILIVFYKINLLFSNSFTSLAKLNDSCQIIKLDSLPKEISIILSDEYNYMSQNNIKSIILIDIKKVNDSTNMYITTSIISLGELLKNIPSYYFTNECCISCIYTGNENIDNLNYKCIEPLLKDAKKYTYTTKDTIEVISKENLIFNEKLPYIQEYDVRINKYFFEKGKLIFHKIEGPRLYKNNTKNKITVLNPKCR